MSADLLFAPASTTCPTAVPSPAACHIFKVSLSVPGQDHISHCVGLGVGPSEDAFREWLHRRMLLSQMFTYLAKMTQVVLLTEREDVSGNEVKW